MLAIVFLSLALSEPPVSTTTGVSQAESFAAAADAHLKLATTSAERPLDEFHNAHTKFDAAFLVDGATVYLCRALAVADLALRSATFTDEQERVSWEEADCLNGSQPSDLRFDFGLLVRHDSLAFLNCFLALAWVSLMA